MHWFIIGGILRPSRSSRSLRYGCWYFTSAKPGRGVFQGNDQQRAQETRAWPLGLRFAAGLPYLPPTANQPLLKGRCCQLQKWNTGGARRGFNVTFPYANFRPFPAPPFTATRSATAQQQHANDVPQRVRAEISTLQNVYLSNRMSRCYR